MIMILHGVVGGLLQEGDLTSQLGLAGGSDEGRSSGVNLVQVNEAPDEQSAIGISFGNIHIVKQNSRGGVGGVHSLDEGSGSGGQVTTQGSSSRDDLTTVAGNGVGIIYPNTYGHLILNIEQNLNRSTIGSLLDSSLIERLFFLL